ncbi:MAG: hypothetical protein ABJH05_09555 [Fulvivirga sp.]
MKNIAKFFIPLCVLIFTQSCKKDDDQVFPDLIAIAGSDVTIRLGESATLGGDPSAVGGSASYTFSWDNDAGTEANPTVSPTETTTYTLTVTDSRQIEDTDEVTVTVLQPDQFMIDNAEIQSAKYSAGGTPTLLYSTDNGSTFSETMPASLSDGTELVVKVSNGSEDLLENFQDFDWSESNPQPSNLTAAQVTFTATEDLSIQVKLADKLALIAITRQEGIVQRINKTSGTTSELFSFFSESDTLKNIRSIVYHKSEDMFYISENTNTGGKLYSADPDTKVATVINPNDGAGGLYPVWDALVNLEIAPNDSILAFGDYNGNGNGMAKFDVDGTRRVDILQMDICCGLGVVYDAMEDPNSVIISNGWDTNDGEAYFDLFDITDGASDQPVATYITRKFVGFPDDLSSDYLYFKELKKDNDGTMFGIILSEDTDKNFLVNVDLETLEVTYISTLSEIRNEYQALALIPEYLL